MLCNMSNTNVHRILKEISTYEKDAINQTGKIKSSQIGLNASASRTQLEVLV